MSNKILVLEDDRIHPTIKTVVRTEDGGSRLITADGLKFNANSVLTVGNMIGDEEFTIESIGVGSIDVLSSDETRYTIPLGNIEWCDFCGDFHVYLDDDNNDVDEYTSGYTDAIRDCVEYLKNSDESIVRNTLRKMNISYMSDLDTDAKISEFVEKRFEKKPQLTLDDLKEIVGYDFDLV